ncbi:UNVERIFIED_ORG: regulatory protein YycI of two-component signal transduction system YycFG [Heyndrickxia coagulans]
MDWSKTKTIFILVFLVLDIYLSCQLYFKHVKNQYEVIGSPTAEQSLKAANITFVNLPKGKAKTAVYQRGRKSIYRKRLEKIEKPAGGNRERVSTQFRF